MSDDSFYEAAVRLREIKNNSASLEVLKHVLDIETNTELDRMRSEITEDG